VSARASGGIAGCHSNDLTRAHANVIVFTIGLKRDFIFHAIRYQLKLIQRNCAAAAAIARPIRLLAQVAHGGPSADAVRRARPDFPHAAAVRILLALHERRHGQKTERQVVTKKRGSGC
jgi:hypothetical protein